MYALANIWHPEDNLLEPVQSLYHVGTQGINSFIKLDCKHIFWLGHLHSSYLSVCLSFYLSIYLSVCLSIHPSIYLSPTIFLSPFFKIFFFSIFAFRDKFRLILNSPQACTCLYEINLSLSLIQSIYYLLLGRFHKGIGMFKFEERKKS